MSKIESSRPKRPVVEVEFQRTAMYELLEKKAASDGQPSAAGPSMQEPTADNLNSTVPDSKNVLLTEEEEDLVSTKDQASFLAGAVIGLGLIVGGYYLWQYWKGPPPLIK